MRTDVSTVAVVGAGSIGGSWAALALARGCTVLAADPAPDVEPRLRSDVATHLAALGADPGALDRLEVGTDAGAAAARADLVLEAGPERVELKRTLFAALDEAAAPDVLLASSSSGSGRARSRTPAATPSGSSSRTRSTRPTWCPWSRSWAAGRPRRRRSRPRWR